MTATPQQLASASQRAVLLTLTWGTSTARYALGDADVTANGQTYTAWTYAETAKLKRNGGAEPETIELDGSGIPDVEPFASFMSQETFAEVTAIFAVTDPSNATANYREMFYGWLLSGEPDEDDDETYIFTFDGIKSRMVRRIGVIADEYCQATLGDERCKVDTSAYEFDATLSATDVDGSPSRVVIDIPGGTDLRGGRWRGGGVIRDGNDIVIRGSQTGNKFDLEHPVPASWVGQTVQVRPGCDGLLKTCKAIWENESEFAGLGVDMVAADAVQETGR